MTEKFYDNENLDDSKKETDNRRPLNNIGEASMGGDPHAYVNEKDIDLYQKARTIGINPDTSNEQKTKEFGDFVNGLRQKDRDVLKTRIHDHNGQTDILGPGGEVTPIKSKNDEPTEEE